MQGKYSNSQENEHFPLLYLHIAKKNASLGTPHHNIIFAEILFMVQVYSRGTEL
jgi:hypothetical protein